MYEKNPKLLVVTFNESLSFESQVKKLREKCINRLSLIKLLSKKLNLKTLCKLYKSLIGSIIDYSGFIIHSLSESNLKKIQAIQNKAYGLIFKKPFDASTDTLCTVSDLPTVCERAKELNERILNKALISICWVTQLVILLLLLFIYFKSIIKRHCH
jgi:hypothetical protein